MPEAGGEVSGKIVLIVYTLNVKADRKNQVKKCIYSIEPGADLKLTWWFTLELWIRDEIDRIRLNPGVQSRNRPDKSENSDPDPVQIPRSRTVPMIHITWISIGVIRSPAIKKFESLNLNKTVFIELRNRSLFYTNIPHSLELYLGKNWRVVLSWTKKKNANREALFR